MKKDLEYIIENDPKKKRKNSIVRYVAFLLSFAFFLGIIVLLWTISPIAYSIYIQKLSAPKETFGQLPIVNNRAIPFHKAVEEAIINPYPSKEPFHPTENARARNSNWIRIPTIGVEVPIVTSASLKDEDVLAALSSGAALYPNGITPGAIGNTFISAHSTGEPWKGAYRFAFIRINELKSGDNIFINWNGAEYTYKIRKRDIVTPTADFLVVSDRPVPTLSLMACYPLWSTKQRMIIHADLTNITQLTKPVSG